jgi:hypothetical protein
MLPEQTSNMVNLVESFPCFELNSELKSDCSASFSTSSPLSLGNKSIYDYSFVN